MFNYLKNKSNTKPLINSNKCSSEKNEFSEFQCCNISGIMDFFSYLQSHFLIYKVLGVFLITKKKKRKIRRIIFNVLFHVLLHFEKQKPVRVFLYLETCTIKSCVGSLLNVVKGSCSIPTVKACAQQIVHSHIFTATTTQLVTTEIRATRAKNRRVWREKTPIY